MAGKHEADPLFSAARDSTAGPYIGKHRDMGRTLEFHFGAITHAHMLSMGNAESRVQLGIPGSVGAAVNARTSAKAVGANLKNPGYPVKIRNKNKPETG